MNTFIKLSSKDIEYNLLHLHQLIFEVTDACNLRCKYCGYADLYEGYDKRENIKFHFVKAKLIIDYLHRIWKQNRCEDVNETISISFYGGEPLLNVSFIKQVIEYLENLDYVGKKFCYNMTTNGVLLDKYMDFLVEKEFRLLISLDGDKEGHSYRVDVNDNNSFDRVFSNVKVLKKIYPKYFDKFVRFNSVLHNKNSVEKAYYFIKNEFGKETSISPLNNSGIRKDKIDEFNRIYRNYNESIQEATNCETLKSEIFINNPETNLLLNYLYNQSGNVFLNYNSLLMQKSQLPLLPSGTCSPFSKKMFVTVKGRILPCERINHEFALGQITDTAVELDWDIVTEQHNNYVYKYVNQCKKCTNKNFCKQCVYQIDDIHDENTKCKSFCSAKQQELINERSLAYLDLHPELYGRILNDVVIR